MSVKDSKRRKEGQTGTVRTPRPPLSVLQMQPCLGIKHWACLRDECKLYSQLNVLQ